MDDRKQECGRHCAARPKDVYFELLTRPCGQYHEAQLFPKNSTSSQGQLRFSCEMQFAFLLVSLINGKYMYLVHVEPEGLESVQKCDKRGIQPCHSMN